MRHQSIVTPARELTNTAMATCKPWDSKSFFWNTVKGSISGTLAVWIPGALESLPMLRVFNWLGLSPPIPTLYGESLLHDVILVISSTGAPGRFCASCSYFVGCLNRLRDNKTTLFNPFTVYVRFNPGSSCFILVSHRNSSSCTFTESTARVVNSPFPCLHFLLILYMCNLLAPHVVRRRMYIVVVVQFKSLITRRSNHLSPHARFGSHCRILSLCGFSPPVLLHWGQ